MAQKAVAVRVFTGVSLELLCWQVQCLCQDGISREFNALPAPQRRAPPRVAAMAIAGCGLRVPAAHHQNPVPTLYCGWLRTVRRRIKGIGREQNRMPPRSEAIVGTASTESGEIVALRSIVEGTARSTGDDFLRTLVRHLALAVGARHSFVAEFIAEQRIRTLAYLSNGHIIDN